MDPLDLVAAFDALRDFSCVNKGHLEFCGHSSFPTAAKEALVPSIV